VVQRHTSGNGPQQLIDDLSAGLGVHPGDDHDGKLVRVPHHRAP
jgi:hypothetical protein